MQCPDCGGSGNKPRPEPVMLPPGEIHIGAHHTAFPALCDRCSGSGEVPAKPPVHEGDAPVPLP